MTKVLTVSQILASIPKAAAEVYSKPVKPDPERDKRMSERTPLEKGMAKIPTTHSSGE